MKKGNISLVLLISFVVILSGASVTSLAIIEKYQARKADERIVNSYIAESGIEIAVGLFLRYLDNQEYMLTYTREADDKFSIVDIDSPYLLEEIEESQNSTSTSIHLVNQESNNYLSSIGFPDFSRKGGVQLALSTMNDISSFKISQMCISPGFVIGSATETEDIRSEVTPLYLTAQSKYKGAEVLCNIEILGIYAIRKSLGTVAVGEPEKVAAWLDTSGTRVKYQNYQNHRTQGGNE